MKEVGAGNYNASFLVEYLYRLYFDVHIPTNSITTAVDKCILVYNFLMRGMTL